MSKYLFSGHESFHCRNLWLKKGYEYAISDKDFGNEYAVIDLGVGKNMVNAIRYWLKAFDIIDENGSINQTTSYILDNKGSDPYIEDIGTQWFLHYQLVTKRKASIYSLFFNEFRKLKVEFSKEHLLNFVEAKCEKRGEKHSLNTIDTDIGVLLKNYIRPKDRTKKKDIEDRFTSLLIDLDLIRPMVNRKDWYECRNEERPSLPNELFLYSILMHSKFGKEKSISFNQLLNYEDAPGLIFALDADSMAKKINDLVKQYDGITYKDDAGIRELQIDIDFKPFDLIRSYYEK